MSIGANLRPPYVMPSDRRLSLDYFLPPSVKLSSSLFATPPWAARAILAPAGPCENEVLKPCSSLQSRIFRKMLLPPHQLPPKPPSAERLQTPSPTPPGGSR